MERQLQIEEAMRARGVRVTPQRAIVLATLVEMPGHPTAQEIHEVAHEQLPGLNLATVYRTLHALHEAGLVDLFSTEAEVQRYAYRDPGNLHSHLVCRECGQVEEIAPALLEPLIEAVAERHDFAIDARHLAFSGTCASCRQSSGSHRRS